MKKNFLILSLFSIIIFSCDSEPISFEGNIESVNITRGDSVKCCMLPKDSLETGSLK